MAQEIKPCEQVQATLTLPGSKSYTHRALMAAALAAGESVLTNALAAEDTELTAAALTQLGAGIDWQGTTIRVTGRAAAGCRRRCPFTWATPAPPCASSRPWWPWERGSTSSPAPRASASGPWGSCSRPWARSGSGRPPKKATAAPRSRVTGGLTGGRAQLSGAISSQYLSALLFIGPLAPAGLAIDITGELVSRPYVDLTLEVLGDFGISYYREGYRSFELPGGQCYLPQAYEIEADASSASYFWAAAALTGGRVTITNLSFESSQGDAAFPEVLGRMGCAIESTPGG